MQRYVAVVDDVIKQIGGIAGARKGKTYSGFTGLCLILGAERSILACDITLSAHVLQVILP